MDVSAGGHAQPALKAGGEVGDDVAEHVVGYDYVERPRVADQGGAERVHVHVLRLDLRIFGGDLFADLFKRPLPQSSGVGHGVGLVAHQDAAARGAVCFLVVQAVFKGVADYPAHALAGIDVFLDSNFVVSSLPGDAATVHVNAFGVFADDDEIQVLRFDSLERAKGRVEQPHWADVRVQVHLEAHAQQNLFGVNIRRDAGIAESSREDGVEVAA